jgi:hypothetical protein
MEIDLGECSHCGWCCEYPESHIEFCRGNCRYIRRRYNVSVNEDGELVWELIRKYYRSNKN